MRTKFPSEELAERQTFEVPEYLRDLGARIDLEEEEKKGEERRKVEEEEERKKNQMEEKDKRGGRKKEERGFRIIRQV